MEAKELMIGDWVLAQFINGNRYARIAAIACDCAVVSVCAVVSIKDRVYDHDYDSIFSIPLTEEILKANGFEDKSDKARYGNVFYGLEHGNISITFEVDNGLPILTIEDTYDRSQEHNVICLKDEIYNVHELQHALRLCGLNELADNLTL